MTISALNLSTEIIQPPTVPFSNLTASDKKRLNAIMVSTTNSTNSTIDNPVFHTVITEKPREKPVFIKSQDDNSCIDEMPFHHTLSIPKPLKPIVLELSHGNIKILKEVIKIFKKLKNKNNTLENISTIIKNSIKIFHDIYKELESDLDSETFLIEKNKFNQYVKTNIVPHIKTYKLLRSIIYSIPNNYISEKDKEIIFNKSAKNEVFRPLVDRYDIDKNFTATLTESNNGIRTISFQKTNK